MWHAVGMMAAVAMHLVRGTEPSGFIPKYTATTPNYQKPYGGLPPLLDAEHYTAFEATPSAGTYNHQPQLHWHGNSFHLAWKNSPYNEDQDGQRILYASSVDGRQWSNAVDLFPSISAARFGCDGANTCFDKIHHESLPFVTLNGRLYGVSSLKRHGPPGSFYPPPADDLNTTVLRRVLIPAIQSPGGCATNDPRSGGPACPKSALRWAQPAFGPLWWATAEVPIGYVNASTAFGIRASTPEALTADERADFALFRNLRGAREYSSESCRNGPCNANNTGEQTVFSSRGTAIDAILYRGKGGELPHGWPGDQGCADPTKCVLLSSWRNTSDTTSPWSPIVATNIPDLGSNLNGGTLSDGSVFLVWNGVPRPPIIDTACDGRPVPLRNPLTLAFSTDGGAHFSTSFALFNSTVAKRYCGSAKPFGPSYPQVTEVVSDSSALDGLWAAYSVNKEDIGITFTPRQILP